jgi:hypothetical protein
MIFHYMKRHNFQEGRQGFLMPKFKVAQDSEIMLIEFKKSFTYEVIHVGTVNLRGAAQEALNNYAGNRGLETAPEFDPKIGPQLFISRGEKKPD